jgi:hypothetical protein
MSSSGELCSAGELGKADAGQLWEKREACDEHGGWAAILTSEGFG